MAAAAAAAACASAFASAFAFALALPYAKRRGGYGRGAVAVAPAVASAVAVAVAVAVALALKLLIYRAPSAATQPTDKTPNGATCRTHVVFRRYRDVSSKNPGGGVDPRRVALWAQRQGVLSFGYFFFAQAKKSDSLPAGE